MINDRVKQIITHFCDGRKSTFAQLIGVTPSVVGNITGKRNGNPSFEVLQKIMNAFASINPDWLILGKGNMFRDETVTTQIVNKSPSINQEFKGSPYYSVDFLGGFDLTENSQTVNPDYYIDYPPYNKEGVVWCNLTGHSMEPELSNGDIIALKPMNTPIEYLPPNEIYAIVTEEYRTVKRIHMSERKGFVRLIPSNKDYQDVEIPVEMITKVFAVLGSIRKFF